jgi:diguanylate cyclase (GGDEF)-like protein
VGESPELIEDNAALAASRETTRLARMANLFLVPTIGGLAVAGTLAARALMGDSSSFLRALLGGLLTMLVAAVPFVTFGVLTLRRQERVNADTEEHERQVIAEARRRAFETQLANALEMAEAEPEVLEAVEHALGATLPHSIAEVLLADNSHAHLRRMVVSSKTGEAPDCAVDSPENCPAARRAQVQRFSSSADLDACPKLRNRVQGECSAVCVPVSIMGRTVGVIHATSAPGNIVDDESVQDLQTLANQTGARIGMLRVMAETQLQAATDSLTGLLNRRALENKVRALRAENTGFAVAMADLDHFKALNDTHGHETGDRALRLFAQTLKTSLRAHDLVCRHGGEEFAVVLPECSAANAAAALEQTRIELSQALRAAGLPEFTVSIGVVDAGDDEDFSSVLERADNALFDAKRQGRDRIVNPDPAGSSFRASEDITTVATDDAPTPVGRH